MATTKNTSVGMTASLKPKLLNRQRSRKVYQIRVPGIGRIGFTKDPGEANLFASPMLITRLGAIVREPTRSVRGQERLGRIIDEIDLGSGVVTNQGVTALAVDGLKNSEGGWPLETATENQNTLSVCKWHSWGTGTTASAAYEFKLVTPAENEVGKKEAVEATTTKLTWLEAGNAKWVTTGKLEAAGSAAITEWGLFSTKKTEGTAAAATGTGATSLTNSGAPFTESKAKARGEALKTVYCPNAETEKAVALILKSTTTVLTIPGWSKVNEAKIATTPAATAKYEILPLMWDRRKFEPINVEAKNIIEFPYELEIKSGS